VTLTLGGDPSRVLVITSGGPAGALYVQSLTVGGKPSTSTWLPWLTVASGGTLDFVLGTTPSTSWGTGPGDRPPAFYP